MTTADHAWRDALATAVERAPATLRALASDELHIGGFTNVQLAHPVLDLRAVTDPALALQALTFFVVAAMLGGATVARVQVRREDADLARRAKRELRAALARVDDESVALLRYFDLYLQPIDALDDAAGRALVRRLERALDAPAHGAS